jgi:hypothetical protein
MNISARYLFYRRPRTAAAQQRLKHGTCEYFRTASILHQLSIGCQQTAGPVQQKPEAPIITPLIAVPVSLSLAMTKTKWYRYQTLLV